MTRLTSIKQTTQYTNNKERTQLFILSTECQFCSPFVCRQHDQSQTSGTDTLNHKIPKSWRSQSFNTPNRIHSQIKVLMSRENMYGAIIIVDMVSCWMLLLHHHRIELFIHLWLPPPSTHCFHLHREFVSSIIFCGSSFDGMSDFPFHCFRRLISFHFTASAEK